MASSTKLLGGGGDDTFNIIGNLTGLTINGEAGTNVVTGEVGSNTTINVVGANSGTVSLVKGVEQTITVNGIDYTVSTQMIGQSLYINWTPQG